MNLDLIQYAVRSHLWIINSGSGIMKEILAKNQETGTGRAAGHSLNILGLAVVAQWLSTDL